MTRTRFSREAKKQGEKKDRRKSEGCFPHSPTRHTAWMSCEQTRLRGNVRQAARLGIWRSGGPSMFLPGIFTCRERYGRADSELWPERLYIWFKTFCRPPKRNARSALVKVGRPPASSCLRDWLVCFFPPRYMLTLCKTIFVQIPLKSYLCKVLGCISGVLTWVSRCQMFLD